MILRAAISQTILFPGSDQSERLLICPAFVFLGNAMQRKMQARLDSLPKTEASFIEPMECLGVSKLPEGAGWLWEVCGGHGLHRCRSNLLVIHNLRAPRG